jgi:hypothetical protein
VREEFEKVQRRPGRAACLDGFTAAADRATKETRRNVSSAKRSLYNNSFLVWTGFKFKNASRVV